jgi:hypothetical protein
VAALVFPLPNTARTVSVYVPTGNAVVARDSSGPVSVSGITFGDSVHAYDTVSVLVVLVHDDIDARLCTASDRPCSIDTDDGDKSSTDTVAL